jgi:uracil-DNA glycosylase
MSLQIHSSWSEILGPELESDYLKKLLQSLKDQKNEGVLIYPPEELLFNAFTQTSFINLKVVIIGQDPYHGAGQAHGLAFSVPNGVRFPPSLNNIFKELEHDYPDFKRPVHGNLSSWAAQGILLLNTTLSVEGAKPASHQKKGWEIFTDHVIRKLSENKAGLIFLLWGKHAQTKKALIDAEKHYILEAAHPSPLSAHSGFFGCRHFSKTNELLKAKGLEPIDWQI